MVPCFLRSSVQTRLKHKHKHKKNEHGSFFLCLCYAYVEVRTSEISISVRRPSWLYSRGKLVSRNFVNTAPEYALVLMLWCSHLLMLYMLMLILAR